MDRKCVGFFEFAPNTGCGVLSVIFLVCSVLRSFFAFQAFLSVIQRTVFFVVGVVFLWMSWIAKSLSEIRVRLDREGLCVWQKRSSKKCFAKWDDFVVVYRVHGGRGVISYVFAVDTMSNEELRTMLKKGGGIPKNVWPCYEGNLLVDGSFYTKIIESYIPDGLVLQDVGKPSWW